MTTVLAPRSEEADVLRASEAGASFATGPGDVPDAVPAVRQAVRRAATMAAPACLLFRSKTVPSLGVE